MFRLIFAFALFCVCAQSVAGACPDGYILNNDGTMCFLFVNMKYNWTESNQYCSDIPNVYAYLASVHNTFDNSLIAEHIFNVTNGSTLSMRLGGYTQSGWNLVDYGWQWNDLSQFDYNNWAMDQGTLAADKNFVVNTTNGKWYTVNPEEKLPFVCQRLSM